MYCSKCGTRLVEDAKFCSKCGAKVEDLYEQEQKNIGKGNIPEKKKKWRRGIIEITVFIGLSIVLSMIGAALKKKRDKDVYYVVDMRIAYDRLHDEDPTNDKEAQKLFEDVLIASYKPDGLTKPEDKKKYEELLEWYKNDWK